MSTLKRSSNFPNLKPQIKEVHSTICFTLYTQNSMLGLQYWWVPVVYRELYIYSFNDNIKMSPLKGSPNFPNLKPQIKEDHSTICFTLSHTQNSMLGLQYWWVPVVYRELYMYIHLMIILKWAPWKDPQISPTSNP